MNNFQKKFVQNDKGLEIFTIEDFISEAECNYLCTIIEKNSTRSTVAGYGTEASVIDPGRTSSTTSIESTDPIVNIIEERMSSLLNIPREKGETFQGQIYTEGQEFKHHFDWFTDDGWVNHCLSSGQRTWTFMVYLNDVEKGGETDFPEIKKRFKPKRGMAVVWKNSDGKGTETTAALHSGMPVKKGKKIIITKWFRENNWDMLEDIRLSAEYHKKSKNEKQNVEQSTAVNRVNLFDITNQPAIKTFSSVRELPRLSEKGFKVIKIPRKIWSFIQDLNFLLEPFKTKEDWQGITKFIHNGKGQAPVDIANFDNCPHIRDVLQEQLKPMHDAFIDYKEELEPVWIYGIRSYSEGAILEMHTDIPTTHHVSSIVIVDKNVREDWPLQIMDHDGNTHEIFTEPGDMILYESATNPHGRIKPLNGSFYKNFFVHYKYKNYKYIGND